MAEEDDQETIEALQSGHSRSTENRIYGLSMDALSGASEDILPFFLDSSTDWHKVCKVVPGGLAGISYQQAKSTNFEALKTSKAFTLGNTLSSPTTHHTLDTNTLVDQVVARIEPLFTNLATLLVQQLQPTLQELVQEAIQQVASKPPTSPTQTDDDSLEYFSRNLPPPTTPSEDVDTDGM